MASEEEERDGGGIVYKMKVVQFLDRTVPIILQNDNGPCPLLAISNVLLLRNNVTLSLDMPEISQRELMSLVAEWLLDANSNIQNKDDEFVKNQQQNIGDAIQLLPRLATGIDVNVRFRHIHDFEFTPECAIFDLFHVGLVHGWLCDPQDEITFRVIGSNSYNTLVEKLVALHASKAEQASQSAAAEEPTVDFAAATIRALKVPSPTYTKRLSDEDFEAMNQVDGKTRRKGDEEEEAELKQALQLSQTDNEVFFKDSVDKEMIASLPSDDSLSVAKDEISHLELTSVVLIDKDGVESLVVENEAITSHPIDKSVLPADSSIPDVLITSIVHVQKEGVESSDIVEEVLEQEFVLSPSESTREGYEEVSMEDQSPSLMLWIKPAHGDNGSGKTALEVVAEEPSRASNGQLESFPTDTAGNEGNKSIFTVGEEVKATVDPLDLDSHNVEDQNMSRSGSVGSSFEHISSKEDKISFGTGSGHLSEGEDCVSSGLEDDEPLYEGERILCESRLTSGDKEPLYEGEGISVVSPEGQESGDGDKQHDDQRLGDDNLSVALTEGLMIENFLSSTASQLTYHGLFSLQDGLKNNELFVFFRNNHFSTLFKYDGQIYLLATDQGYLAQPDLVWEKLTEVDGDTVFATGSFDQFQVDQSNGSWNERDAVAATADFMSSQQMTGSSTDEASYNSDLQLAMALQQQELAQQQQQQEARTASSAPPRPSQPSAKTSSIGAGRLVTGPARSNVPPPKQEKAKEKCTIM